MSKQPTVFVVDDEAAMRDSLRWLLESVGITVRTFAGGAEFLEAYDGSLPGCLVMDIRMPGMSGLELQQELLDRGLTIPIVAVTGFGEVPMAVQAMGRGAVDFLEKPFSNQRIVESVRRALEEDGKRRKATERMGRALECYETLSPRERQVFRLVVAGRSNKQAAVSLGVSPKTIEVHRSHMMKKLGAKSLAELIRMSVELPDLPDNGSQRRSGGH